MHGGNAQTDHGTPLARVRAHGIVRGASVHGRRGVVVLAALLWVLVGSSVAVHFSAALHDGLHVAGAYRETAAGHEAIQGMEAWGSRMIQTGYPLTGATATVQTSPENWQVQGNLEPVDGRWDLNTRWRLGTTDPNAFGKTMVRQIEAWILEQAQISAPGWETWQISQPGQIPWPTWWDFLEAASRRWPDQNWSALEQWATCFPVDNHPMAGAYASVINVNLAPPMVLALALGRSVSEVVAWRAQRGTKPWTEQTWQSEVVAATPGLSSRIAALQSARVGLGYLPRHHVLTTVVTDPKRHMGWRMQTGWSQETTGLQMRWRLEGAGP